MSDRPPDPSPPGLVDHPPSAIRVGDTFGFTVDKTNISTVTMTGLSYVFEVAETGSGGGSATAPIVLPEGPGGFDETLDLSTTPLRLVLRPQASSANNSLTSGQSEVFAFDNWRAMRAGEALVSMWTESNEFSANTASIITITITVT